VTRGALLAVAVWSSALPALAAPPIRKPLSSAERTSVLALMDAADRARHGGDVPSGALIWDSAILRSTDGNMYVPFKVTLGAGTDGITSGTLFVRAVSRHNGVPVVAEQSRLRPWVENPNKKIEGPIQTLIMPPGEMPVGGPASTSIRQATQAAAASFATLELQQRGLQKQKAQAETVHLIFPFEEYYFFDFRNALPGERSIARALALPPGEYDFYVGVVDRRKGSTAAMLKQTMSIPDYWNDRLALSTLMLVSDVRTLKAPLPVEQQAERPFTFGQAEVVPVPSTRFTPDQVLSVVYQMCNYGAPDADLTAEYTFYHRGAPRRLFNRTDPQQFADADLPPANPWTTQAFAMQTVSLASFPPGEYELEVTVRDRLTRATATGRVAFTVAVR